MWAEDEDSAADTYTHHNLPERIRFLYVYVYMYLWVPIGMGNYTRVICCGNTAEVARQVKGRRSISYNNIIAYLTHIIQLMCAANVFVYANAHTRNIRV